MRGSQGPAVSVGLTQLADPMGLVMICAQWLDSALTFDYPRGHRLLQDRCALLKEKSHGSANHCRGRELTPAPAPPPGLTGDEDTVKAYLVSGPDTGSWNLRGK